MKHQAMRFVIIATITILIGLILMAGWLVWAEQVVRAGGK